MQRFTFFRGGGGSLEPNRRKKARYVCKGHIRIVGGEVVLNSFMVLFRYSFGRTNLSISIIFPLSDHFYLQ